MSMDGKQLERLVAFVEKALSPKGFTVSANERVFNDDGVQIAEFDVLVTGKFGSTEIRWLIECRDRPGQGPTPGGWIEQLVGRRIRFGFNKVTAVSTTGFTQGAIECATSQGIELREVASLHPDAFRSWLLATHMTEIRRTTELRHANIFLGKTEPEEVKNALADLLTTVSGDSPILRSIKTGDLVQPSIAFLAAVEARGGVFDDVINDGSEKSIELHADYAFDDDHFVIDTAVGTVRIREIVFTGVLRSELIEIPLSGGSEYRQFDSKDAISQIATFSPQEILGTKVTLEFHRIAETGETHILMRKLPAK